MTTDLEVHGKKADRGSERGAPTPGYQLAALRGAKTDSVPVSRPQLTLPVAHKASFKMQILHKWAVRRVISVNRPLCPSPHKPPSASRLHASATPVAPKMQPVNAMKTLVHDIVRQLLELQALEERRERNREKKAEVQALIESLRANLPAAVLIDHDRMRNKDKASVAEVRRGICTGCHLALAVGNV